MANLPKGLDEVRVEGQGALEVALPLSEKLQLGEERMGLEQMWWKRRAKKRH